MTIVLVEPENRELGRDDTAWHGGQVTECNAGALRNKL